MHAYSQSAQTWITPLHLQITPRLPFLGKLAPDGATTRDVPDIRFRLAGYPAIFCYPVPDPAKILPVARQCNRIGWLVGV